MIPRSLVLVMRDTPCAHSCRYCNMGAKQYAGVSRLRLNKLIERFIDWQDTAGKEFTIAVAGGFSAEIQSHIAQDIVLETERLHRILGKRRGLETGRLHLGGLKRRSPDETQAWLQSRYDEGDRFANASYTGVREIHDYWNRRAGDFDHLLQLQRIAAEMGMALGQYLFVIQSSFPYLERLLDYLDDLPQPAAERTAIPFGYIGRARSYEDERITEAHRERLPDRVAKLIPERLTWRSEREWMTAGLDDEPQGLHGLWLVVDQNNIDLLEGTACSDIVAELEEKTRSAYETIPSWVYLRDHYGNGDGIAIYASRDEIARKWLDRYLDEHPVIFDRRLTHLRASF